MYSEVASLGSLLAKDKNIKVIFIQNSLLVSFILRVLLVTHVCAILESNLDATNCDIPTARFIEQDSYPNGIRL